jgi:hypothetical protein
MNRERLVAGLEALLKLSPLGEHSDGGDEEPECLTCEALGLKRCHCEAAQDDGRDG